MVSGRRIDQGSVLVADSNGGTLWRLDLAARAAMPWLRHDLLAHQNGASEKTYPGGH